MIENVIGIAGIVVSMLIMIMWVFIIKFVFFPQFYYIRNFMLKISKLVRK